jgi:hypothetical protein
MSYLTCDTCSAPVTLWSVWTLEKHNQNIVWECDEHAAAAKLFVVLYLPSLLLAAAAAAAAAADDAAVA